MSLAADPARHSLLELDARTRRRNASEARFRMYGVAAIAIAVLALIVLLISVLSNGASAFRQTFIAFDVALDEKVVDPKGGRDPALMAKVTTIGYGKLLQKSLVAALAARGVETGGVKDKDIAGLLSKEAAAQLRNQLADSLLALYVDRTRAALGSTVDQQALQLAIGGTSN